MTTRPARTPLLIGVGNRDRGDDGIGPAVVDEVRRRGAIQVDTLVREGDLADLALCWEHHDDVTIVDACRTGAPVATVVSIDPARATRSGGYSTHGLGVAEACALAARLGRLPPVVRVLGVEGQHFGWGPLSPDVATAIPDIADAVLAAMERPAPTRS